MVVTPAARRRRGHGDPAPYQRASDGRWVGTVWLPNPGGKPIRKYVYGATQKEAQKKRDILKASVAHGVLPDSITLAQWLRYWLDVIAPAKRKATTIDRNRSYVETWIIPTIGAVNLQDLRVDHVRLMIGKMQKATSERTHKPLAARTIIKARAVLMAALTVAEKEGRVLRNVAKPADAPEMKVKPKLGSLTPAQAMKVIDRATDTRERARLAVALTAALRQGEALALRWTEVALAPDGSGGTIEVLMAATRVRGQGMVIDSPKTLRSVRVVTIGPACAQMLLAWREKSGGHGFVFPGFRGPEVVEDSRRDYDVWKKSLVRAGVPHVRLHSARGTAESMWASTQPAWAAAEMAGHSEDVAIKFYNKSTPEQRALMAQATDAFAAESGEQ